MSIDIREVAEPVVNDAVLTREVAGDAVVDHASSHAAKEGVVNQAAVQLGALTLGTPVMLAPMAGVTNPPFRQLCREQGEAGMRAAGVSPSVAGHRPGIYAPAGLWVCEMVTTRAHDPGAALLFSGPKPLAADDIARAALELMDSHQIFRVVPRWRGVIARSTDVAPAAGLRALSLMRTLGLRRQRSL